MNKEKLTVEEIEARLKKMIEDDLEKISVIHDGMRVYTKPLSVLYEKYGGAQSFMMLLVKLGISQEA